MTTGAGRQFGAQHSHSLEGWYARIPGLRILTRPTVEDYPDITSITSTVAYLRAHRSSARSPVRGSGPPQMGRWALPTSRPMWFGRARPT
jgi:hypothetical protein